MFDKAKFKSCVRDCEVGLNEVLEEGLDLHPLKEQRESVSKYRQIGLGVMGIADMLIKLNIDMDQMKLLNYVKNYQI